MKRRPMEYRQQAAEFIGTKMMLATIIGSGIMAETLSAGNDAIALLANTIATGAILVVLITVFGPVSGAHFNPAISLVFWLRGELDRRRCLLFVLCQIAGGVAGTLLAHFMFELPLIQLSQQARSGVSQFGSEIVATAGLIGVILGGLASRPRAVPMLVGLYISAAYWFTASTSFANPAVTLARAISDTFAGIAPSDMPVFILGQLLAVYPAAKISGWLFRPSEY